MLTIKTCPTCGSSSIKKVRKTVHTTAAGRDVATAGVTFHECPACGEKIYGHEAMRKMEAHLRRLQPTG